MGPTRDGTFSAVPNHGKSSVVSSNGAMRPPPQVKELLWTVVWTVKDSKGRKIIK